MILYPINSWRDRIKNVPDYPAGTIVHCLFCDTPFKKRNNKHKFCNPDCAYCYRRDGTPFRDRGWYWSDEENRLFIPEDEIKIKEIKKPVNHPERRKKLPVQYKKDLPKFGYIYLMKAENGIHKIGRAKNVDQRLKDLNREIPIRVEVIHYIKSNDFHRAEKRLHSQYAKQRIKYEWFSLSDEQVAEILHLNDYELDAQ